MDPQYTAIIISLAFCFCVALLLWYTDEEIQRDRKQRKLNKLIKTYRFDMEHLKIQIPEGHEIDTEKSDLASGVIVFKKKVIRGWRDNPQREVKGYYISSLSTINPVTQRACVGNLNTFSTEEQALSALAMAQLSQIIANDSRFGGPITDEEWDNYTIRKYIISRVSSTVQEGTSATTYRFLAFHTESQRDLFLEENMDLIKQYFML